jgi:hypothetical protein
MGSSRSAAALAFLIDNSILYFLLEVFLVVLLLWAASASWVITRRRTE